MKPVPPIVSCAWVVCALALSAGAAYAGAKEDGFAALAAQRYDDAARLLGQARVEDPNDPQVGNALGAALYRAGRYRESEQIFSAVADRASDASAAARARYNAGNAAYKGGRLDQALSYYQTAMGKDPTFAEAQQNATAVQKEIQARRNQPPPQSDSAPSPQDGQQDQQPQDGQQGQQAQSGQQGQPPQDGQQGQPGQQAQDGQPGQQPQDGQQAQSGQQPPAGTPPADGDGTRDAPPADADAQPGAPSATASADGEPTEGEADAAEAGAEVPDGVGRPGMSAAAAAQLVDSVQDGKPRVVVGRPSGGKDW